MRSVIPAGGLWLSSQLDVVRALLKGGVVPRSHPNWVPQSHALPKFELSPGVPAASFLFSLVSAVLEKIPSEAFLSGVSFCPQISLMTEGAGSGLSQ